MAVLSAVARDLAARHMKLACQIASGFRIRDDDGLATSVALEALCEAAGRWQPPGDFEAFAAVVIRRRLTDEWRHRRGRTGSSPRRRWRTVVLHEHTDPGTDGGLEMSDLLVDLEGVGLSGRHAEGLALRTAGWTLLDIGARWGVSEARVSQIVREAQARCRRRMAAA